MSEIRPTSASLGLNLNSTLSQKKEGELSYALNAILENWDGERVTYQNEMRNTECITFPEGYRIIGGRNIIEKGYTIFMLANPSTNQSEIGKVVNDSCTYERIINADCLGFSIEHPIHKIHTKVTNCSTELYWRDPVMRWIDLENLPYTQYDDPNTCTLITTNIVDCNKLRVQPNFSVPSIRWTNVGTGGEIVEGDYQFAVQYSNANGDGYTQYYAVTNSIPIFNKFKVTQDFNTLTDKSISFLIQNLDTSGVYDYINIAVIKTINLISSVELVETRNITAPTMSVIYTGVNKTNIRLTIDDVKERFPVYEKAEDSFEVQDVLGWADVTTTQRVNYQKIFNKLKLQWQSNRLSSAVGEGYSEPLNVVNYTSYMRDEIYALEGAFILDDGTITDGFHIPSRPATSYDLEIIDNADTRKGAKCEITASTPRWKIYNTASSLGRVKECEEANSGQPFGAGRISLFCSDDGCSQQGEISVHLEFDVATPEPVTLLIGSIYYYDNGNKTAQGYDIFPIPPGVSIETYFVEFSNRPFELHIPAGVTSYDIPEIIFLQGTDINTSIHNSWMCQGCAFPVAEVYIKSITNSNYKITFTSPQSQLKVNNVPVNDSNIHIFPPKGECADECYEGIYEWGEFAYWESSELYPCDVDVWGELADKPIRHHKFPDSLVSHIHDNKGNIYPMGLRVNMDGLKELIRDSDLTEEQKRKIVGVKILRGNRATNKSIDAKGLIYNVGQYTRDGQTTFYPNYPFNDLRKDPFLNIIRTTNDSGDNRGTALDGFSTDESRKRYSFLSPDTLFYQPNGLGSSLKLETVEYGQSKGHMVQVKEHARYKFLSKGSYGTALAAAILVGLASNEAGLTVKIFDGTAAYAAFQAVVSIIDKSIPRLNFAYQFNSLGVYDKYLPIQNNGNKIRNSDIVNYLIPGMTSAGDIHPINNYQRESSVYIRTTGTLPYPHEVGAPQDESRWTLSSEGICDTKSDVKIKPISSYYASIKSDIVNQYGAIYSYETIDTGFQFELHPYSTQLQGWKAVFGGDTYINKFALKRKLPFFLDNRVKFIDDSDIAYNDLSNVANPTYWLSTDYKGDGEEGEGRRGIAKFFGVKINNFDCRDDRFFYQQGKFYLFAYGVSYFFVESSVNTDFRQAFNDKEGDFFPHVGEDIPDEWLQEIKTTIQQDNTYFYNKTYSKQNKESYFSHIPPDFEPNCFYNFPNLAIYSDQQTDKINYKKNNWLIYRPVSQFPFPLNYGKLTSIEGIENRAVLVRFENSSLIYNALLTINTSLPQAAYLGNDSLFKSSPPISFVETDLGFNGSQHKMFLRTEFGGISVDAKRGDVFIIGGNKATAISGAEFKVDSFFKEKLNFEILQYFPAIDIDNHFNGVGITGTIDNKFERLLLTKLDYVPIVEGIKYENGMFSYGGDEISLRNTIYFIDRSFTISFDLKNRVWMSFHSYKPNFYLGDVKTFFSGINGPSSSLWKHNSDVTGYNNFYSEIEPYILEYPLNYKLHDEILQSVSDYTQSVRYIDETSKVVGDVYFNKAIIFNDEQCSGVRNLVRKPTSAREYLSYPIHREDSVDILYTRSGNYFNYNGFWDVVNDSTLPIFLQSTSGIDKDLNTANMDYSKRSHRKSTIRGKNTSIRHILDNRDDVHLISQFLIAITQISYK